MSFVSESTQSRCARVRLLLMLVLLQLYANGRVRNVRCLSTAWACCRSARNSHSHRTYSEHILFSCFVSRSRNDDVSMNSENCLAFSETYYYDDIYACSVCVCASACERPTEFLMFLCASVCRHSLLCQIISFHFNESSFISAARSLLFWQQASIALEVEIFTFKSNLLDAIRRLTSLLPSNAPPQTQLRSAKLCQVGVHSIRERTQWLWIIICEKCADMRRKVLLHVLSLHLSSSGVQFNKWLLISCKLSSFHSTN